MAGLADSADRLVGQLMCRAAAPRKSIGRGSNHSRIAAENFAVLRKISQKLRRCGGRLFAIEDRIERVTLHWPLCRSGSLQCLVHEAVESVEVEGFLEVFEGSEALGFLLRAILFEGGHHNDGAF